MLRAHYWAPNRTVTAEQLAGAIGYSSYVSVNMHYGRLARLVGEHLGYDPEPERLGTLVRFEKREDRWHWIMRQEVAQALEFLGWVQPELPQFPEEVDDSTPLFEGAVRQVRVNAYERNPEARKRCIEHYGACCCVCGFNFGQVYGEVVEGFIHVHHLLALSAIGREYVVDPIKDLRPVCPNCHAVLHRRNPAYSIEEIRAFLRATSAA